MLNKIKLTNFQRHRDLEVSFTGGLSAIRGGNEAGKSTLLRAICYALFGAKALNESLEETVTWGEDAKTLKVELEIAIDAVPYSIKRGKSGAEIQYDGGIVTGQNETTSFLCRLLKVDASSASRLMLANQNEIRGALESGTKATTELIEKLAEFSQLDNLLDRMQENLALGTSGNVEAAIAYANSALEEAEKLAVAPDTLAMQADIDILADEVNANEEGQKALAEQVDSAKEALILVKSRAAERAALALEERKASLRISEIGEKLVKLSQVKEPVNPKTRIGHLRKAVADAENCAELSKVYGSVEGLFKPRMTDFVWKGSREDLVGALTKLDLSNRADSVDQAKLEGQINLLRQQLLQGSCTFCGKDFSGVPEVISKNSEIQQKLDEALNVRDQIKARLATSLSLAEAKRNCEMASRPTLAALAKHEGLVELSDDFMPPVLRWVGEVPSAGASSPALRRQIDEIEAQQTQFTKAQAASGPLTEEIARLKKDLLGIGEKLSAQPEVDLTDARVDLQRAEGMMEACIADIKRKQADLRDAETKLRDALAAHERAKAQVEVHKAALAQRKEELKALNFNNALLKKVRSARPLIADKLWNLVLSAVSSYFSDIRGAASEVTKEADGFKVDGHSVSTLSGSTLDALGLAIRVALVRTFLPAAPFLILDEPGSGMDTERTQNMLGFLAGCGFGQILLVTHEDVSESIADNMITL